MENTITSMATKRYVLLEDGITYDNDDWYVWGAVLYDCQEKKIVTMTYGHGQDLSCRNECCKLSEAVELGLTTEDEIKVCILNGVKISFKNFDIVGYACQHNINNPIAIPVTIVKGRKGKGKRGTLVYGESKRNYYGWGRYHEVYDEFAYVLEEGTNKVHKVCSFSYLEFDSDFVAKYDEQLKEDVRKRAETHNLAHIYAYKMSYASCDRYNKQYSISQYSGMAKDLLTATDAVKKALNAYQEECDRIANEKREALKQEVMPKLIDWVLTNTDKKGEEVEKLALHIFNKRY